VARVSIPGYTIERELGSGGMAKVYLAMQHSLERKVALKVMSPILAADESFSKRFLREARTIAGLTHPNIVAIYEVGVTVDNLHFFAMQHLPGGDFAERMRAGVSEAELKRVLAGIGKALGFAHERGFVHRDVTPANILFDPTGSPVLTDFGIARAVGGSTRITHTGVSIGTSIYMSPEQARGAEVDARSDLYSLGVLCFEALTGQVPFKGADSFAVAYAHVFEPIPRLPADRTHWQPLIDRALAKDARDRFASAEEMCAALMAIGDVNDSAATQKMAVLGATSESKDLVRPAAVTQLVQAVGDRIKSRQKLPEGAFKRYAIAALALLAVFGLGYGGYHQWAQNGADEVAAVVSGATAPAPASGLVAPVVAPAPIEADAPADGDPLYSSGVAEMLASAGYPVVIGDEEQERWRMGPRSRASQLAMWLASGEQAVGELRLQTPAGTSAVDFYALVLAEDGANEAALRGLAAVVDKYIELAAREHEQQKLEEARSMLERARQVAALHPQPAPQLQRVSERETLWVGALIGQAEAALAAWDRKAALAALEQAVRLAPQDPRIESLRGQAESFAQAGFRFQDRLRDGGRAPRMIVVAPREVELQGAKASRRATLDTPFAVSQYEITRAEFARFVQASGRSVGGSCRNREASGFFGAKASRDWRDPDIRQADDHPVVCVDFEDAQAYSRWLSQETGHVYRLLSEAEWQALAAAVQSNGLCAVANLADQTHGGRNAFACDDGIADTAPVGRYAAANGVHDLDGNVREWVQDCANDSHAGHSGTQAARLSGDCSERMALGRAWHSDKDESSLRQRKAFKANVRSNTIGFRVAMTLPQGPPG
jgi:serine/threonine-protein kinase PpkA